jgi:hypothetical protein
LGLTDFWGLRTSGGPRTYVCLGTPWGLETPGARGPLGVWCHLGAPRPIQAWEPLGAWRPLGAQMPLGPLKTPGSPGTLWSPVNFGGLGGGPVTLRSLGIPGAQETLGPRKSMRPQNLCLSGGQISPTSPHFLSFFVRCDREVATDYSFTCLLRFMCLLL